MYPWNWMWSPQFHFPLSGSLVQDISPDTSWFFGAIRPEAGVGRLEQQIFESASYGKQLGLILDVLLPLVGEGALDSPQAKKSVAELKQLYRKIEKIKTDNREHQESAAVSLLDKIAASDPAMLKRILHRFEAVAPSPD